MTTADAATFPTGMRRLGWILASLMMLYPVDAVLAERARQQLLAAEAATQETQPAAGGMQFDLRTASTHDGPLGWAGAWAFMLGVVWALVASGLWLHYRLKGRTLTTSSRRAFFVVSCGVMVVLGVLAIQSYQWRRAHGSATMPNKAMHQSGRWS